MVDSSAWANVIRRIHDSPVVAVLAITGGGSGAIAHLLNVPGASRTVLEARVPYAHGALVDWLKWSPEQDCSRRTALAMAAVAWRRAGELTASEPERWASAIRLGVACTAALASDRPKRGDHRCWVASHGIEETRLYGLTFVKGARTRPEEESVTATLVLRALAEAAGIRDVPEPALLSEEKVQSECQAGAPLLKELAAGRRSIVWRWPDGRLRAEPPQPPAGVLCGSFDPLHSGHQKLRRVAEERLEGPVVYELTLFNADKPPLDYITVAERCRQFQDAPVALTAAGTFAEKAPLFPNTTFVVGFDTACRLLQPRFYGDSDARMQTALDQLRRQGCRFLVAGRCIDGVFYTVNDLAIPRPWTGLFIELPESAFRADVSATELRRRRISDGGPQTE